MVSYIKEGTKAKGILNMIQRKTFRSKRGNIVKWRRLHIEELYNVYRSLNIVRVSKSTRIEEDKRAFKILTGKSGGKGLLGMSSRRREENIRMDFTEIDVSKGIWVDSAQNRDCWRALSNTTLNIWVP